MKRRASDDALRCYPHYGPIFGNYYWSYDIFINDSCNRENSCSINNDGFNAYASHPRYIEFIL